MKFKNLPAWLKGGIIGAVLFLIIWNILFLISYLFEISQLWNILFYIVYPIMRPIIQLANFLFGVCYINGKCLARIPLIFILMTITEGFIIGTIMQYIKNIKFQNKSKNKEKIKKK